MAEKKETERDRGVDEKILDQWTQEQIVLKQSLKLYDTEPWQSSRKIYDNADQTGLRYVAGLDISYSDDGQGISGLFVFEMNNADSRMMTLVYKDVDSEFIKMDQPYVPGFLAYREGPPLLRKLEKLRQTKPEIYPQLLLIDGNGILHPHKFGFACFLGVKSDTPSLGVSKKLYQVLGLEKSEAHRRRIKEELKKRGDYFDLMSNEERPEKVAICYRSTDEAPNPVYVSIGHKMSWETCVWLMERMVAKCRIPEPIRYADLTTREVIRELGGYAAKSQKTESTDND